MQKKRFVQTLMLLFLISYSTSLAGRFLVREAWAQETVSITPTTSVFEKGAEFTVSVDVSYVEMLRGWQFSIRYDSAILYTDEGMTDEGSFLRSSGASTFFAEDVTSSSITLACLITSHDWVDGGGTLATIRFRVVSTGRVDLHLYDTVFLDPDGNPAPIQLEPVDGVFYTTFPKASFNHLPSREPGPIQQLPNASLLHDPVVGELITFNATAFILSGFYKGSYDPDGTITQYLWDFGDGNVTAMTSSVITHAYNISGWHQVNLTVTDNDGKTDSYARSALVTAAPFASFTYSPSDPVAGETVNFDASTSFDPNGYILSYSWNFADGFNITETDPFTTYVFATPGTYLVTLTVTDNDGLNDTAEALLTVTMPPAQTYTRIYLPNQWVSEGVAMGWHADDSSWQYTLPFDFPFYGTYYRTIYISSNSLITFTSPDSSYSNSISWLGNKLTIAVAWDDWLTYSPNDIYIWQPDSNHVIIRWDARHISSGAAGNFEAILGQDGVIQFNYGYNDGSISATVGISNGVSEILAEDITASNYINSILFTPYRPEHDLEAYLEAPSSLMLSQPSTLEASVYNFGTSNEFNVELQLFINGTIVDSVGIPELLSGSTYTLNYTWTPTAEGWYNVTAYALPVPDENVIANNLATTTVNVVTIESTFREDFSTPTLDPHWQVWRYPIPAPSPPEATYQQETRYSLTDNPGYLRYYLGSMTSEWASEPVWAGPSSPYWYYPSMHLYRMFEDTNWILETQVTYSAPYANAANHAFYVFFGDPQQRQEYRNNAIIVEASVWDAWHYVYITENGVQRALTSLPINRYSDTFYYRIIRLGHQFSFQWSRDGVSYTTALTETIGSQIDGLPQGVGITGQAFWSDTNSYSAHNYIHLTPPPQHELAVSLQAPSVNLVDRLNTLNATVYNGGLNDETNVELQLLIDGSLIDSVLIPELPRGSSYTIGYSWTPTIEGTYNITAYAIPVPSEADTTNNRMTRFTTVVHPLIQPMEGQWANYTITTPYGRQLLNATYSHYITPIQMYITLWMKDPYGNSWTNWLTLNILNRQVEAGMWSGYWYPLWIQTDVAIGSTVGILDRTGTVAESRYIEVGEYLVESWGLQVQYYDWLYTFWFDKVNGLVVAVEGINPYYNYTEGWQLTATNVPLVYLPRLRIQIAPESGPVGTAVTVTGVNAMSNATVEIYYDETYMGTATADNDGNFVFTLTAPPTTRGIYTIRAVDLTTNISDSKVFTVLSSISVTPLSGPMGSTVQVSGLGFGAYEEVVVCFEDMQIGEVYADASGSFIATFSIPLSQSGAHLIKAWYSNTEYGQTTFTVTDVEPLDVQIDAGTIYFKGETAEFYVLTTFKGKPIDITLMNATLYMSDGTTQRLTYQRIATGLYKIRYTISGKGVMTGTYTLVVEAGSITGIVNAYGTSLRTFIVKPTWEREATRTAAFSIASVGLVSAMILLWRKEKKKLL